MAEIFILNTKGCEDLILSLSERVSDKRRSAVSKIKRDEAKIRSIASELVLAFSLKLPLPLSYKTDKNGKPWHVKIGYADTEKGYVPSVIKGIPLKDQMLVWNVTTTQQWEELV